MASDHGLVTHFSVHFRRINKPKKIGLEAAVGGKFATLLVLENFETVTNYFSTVMAETASKQAEFGMVPHWATMTKFKTGQKLVKTIQHLDVKATSAVLGQSPIEEWFQTSVGVRRGCLLSSDTLQRLPHHKAHVGTVNIGETNIRKLQIC